MPHVADRVQVADIGAAVNSHGRVAHPPKDPHPVLKHRDDMIMLKQEVLIRKTEDLQRQMPQRLVRLALLNHANAMGLRIQWRAVVDRDGINGLSHGEE